MKRFLIFLSICFLGTSCEDVIVLNLNTAEERLSIDARIKMNPENTDLQVIVLSLTGGFYDESVQWVTDAEVEILDVDNNITHLFLHDAVNPGHYILDFTPNFDVNYKLEILYNGETYKSSLQQLIPATPINNLLQGDETLFEGDEIEVIVTFTDDGSREDFYVLDFGYNNFLATKDEFYQGNAFTFSYFYEDLEPGDTAFVTIYGADEAYFNFMSAVIEQTEEGGDPFKTTPTSVRGNIYNTSEANHYPMGYFSISETFNASLLIE
tara:strand:- start:1488 stop:2288 length:801 start_codon:yes stop_codon:yes gene_type:complete